MVVGGWWLVAGGWWLVAGGWWRCKFRVSTNSDVSSKAAKNMKIKSYRDLETWQKSIELVEEVYKETRSFPKEEIYGLISQMRRAAVSVPSNIAEGQGRDSTNEILRHLSIAYGSLCELQTQMLICYKLSYLNRQTYERLEDVSASVARLINGLANSLRK
jgi:four helix bundle protein